MITEIEVDASCRNAMLWRCDLTEPLPEGALVAALMSDVMEGDVFDDTTQTVSGVLFILQHRATGHQVVYVPRTGRLQIRLDGLTPPADRVPWAKQIYVVLSRACAVASAT